MFSGCFSALNQVSSCFSCSAERCDSVSLWSSRTVLQTRTLSISIFQFSFSKRNFFVTSWRFERSASLIRAQKEVAAPHLNTVSGLQERGRGRRPYGDHIVPKRVHIHQWHHTTGNWYILRKISDSWQFNSPWNQQEVVALLLLSHLRNFLGSVSPQGGKRDAGQVLLLSFFPES